MNTNWFSAEDCRRARAIVEGWPIHEATADEERFADRHYESCPFCEAAVSGDRDHVPALREAVRRSGGAPNLLREQIRARIRDEGLDRRG